MRNGIEPKEGIFELAFDGTKIVLAQAQQTEEALQDVAVDDTRSNREGRVDQAVEVDSFEILANQ
jgi:hypothetical protein